jgi:peptide-methionine (S)-S-oxide reductase
VSYNTLLEVFFGSHDPTTLNRQGPDAGRQYRSAIFYGDETEKALTEAYIEKLYADVVYRRGAITTEVSKLTAFYPAEQYHQNYEKNNPDNPYVQGVSVPRLKKFLSKFPHLLKEGEH